ncbi:MAG TPA: alpha-galactosidase [Vicinamibacteria bacterium]
MTARSSGVGAAGAFVLAATMAFGGDGPSVRVESAPGAVVLRTPVAAFEIRSSGYVGARLVFEGGEATLDEPGAPPRPGVEVRVEGGGVLSPVFDLDRLAESRTSGLLGPRGRRVDLPGRAGRALLAHLTVEVFDDFPSLAVVSLHLENATSSELRLAGLSLLRRRLSAARVGPRAPFDLWSFQGASVEWGEDDVVRLSRGFARENPMGPARPDGLGGGVPVADFWTAVAGTAIGSLEPTALSLSIPVRTEGDGRVGTEIRFPALAALRPGEDYRSPTAFVSAHAGDYYDALRTWSLALARRGLALPRPSPQAYEASWCGWGYGLDVTPAQMTGTIPMLKELGLRWATLDDRWFDSYGDWEPREDTFPRDAIHGMVEAFHREGIKLQLWWYPAAAEDEAGPGSRHARGAARVVAQHPDWLILGPDGQRARLPRGLAALCPALPAVREYHRALTERFVRDWGFDGHKLDVVYSVPPCYNPAHGHASPQESVQALAELYRVIFDTTRALETEAVTQICPCGTPPNFTLLPFLDQAVAADPIGASQVRRRIKMYKALLGPEAAVYGDHVELSDVVRQGRGWLQRGRDFASTLGPGGVVGTKFTWPDRGPAFTDVFLDPAKEAHWKKWIALYDAKRLSSGTFRNLYVYGYDLPEAYAIEKDGRMHYAFFSPAPDAPWEGEIELRGLAPGRYLVFDYESEREMGWVEAERPRLHVRFTGHLLLEVSARPRLAHVDAP